VRRFIIGETVVISAVTKKLGIPINPQSGMRITIWKPDGTVDVNDVAMSNPTTGNFEYIYSTANKPAGDYRVRLTSVDGFKLAKLDTAFELEP
jgi:hypothetical protein